MKVKHWISLSLASLVFVSFLGTITKNQASDQVPPPVVSSVTPSSMPPMIAQNFQQSTVIKSGKFKSGEHPTQGTARVITQDGQTFLELDQKFKTSPSGPDLVVVLHRSNHVLANTTPPAYPLQESDFVVLAPLKQFNGAQRYAIPDHVNLANFQSAVIWCRQFNATFGAATLS